MIDYTDTGNCRSIYINQYFGDHSIKACGICDNCLKTKATGLTHDEFEKITRNIESELSANKLTASDLLQKLKSTNKEKARSVLNFLQAEQKLSMNDKGELSLTS